MWVGSEQKGELYSKNHTKGHTYKKKSVSPTEEKKQLAWDTLRKYTDLIILIVGH